MSKKFKKYWKELGDSKLFRFNVIVDYANGLHFELDDIEFNAPNYGDAESKVRESFDRVANKYGGLKNITIVEIL